ncbi:hypothetical protein C0989_007618 [Termitomyces sp. Mn162]|nr:hypothetical protein C0989_007618 [Termitomyces sp. Mn162]
MNLINVVLFVTQDETLQAINLPLILNLRKPRNLLPLGNDGFDSDPSKGMGVWRTPGKQDESYEFSTSTSATTGGVAIITTTDTVNT